METMSFYNTVRKRNTQTMVMEKRRTWFEEVEKTVDQLFKIYQIKVKGRCEYNYATSNLKQLIIRIFYFYFLQVLLVVIECKITLLHKVKWVYRKSRVFGYLINYVFFHGHTGQFPLFILKTNYRVIFVDCTEYTKTSMLHT